MAPAAPLVRSENSGSVALLTIDNPPVNATSHALRAALKAALEAALADETVPAVILIGAGRGFIAGADIAEFDRKREEPLNPTIIAAMERSQKPIIAAIHGHALGGGLELAMGCHFRIATQEAKLGQPEVKIGLTPGAGGTQRLPRLVGLPLALRMIVSGDPIDAKAAHEHGLIDAIVTGDLRAGAIAFAGEIVRGGTKLPRVRDRAAAVPPSAGFFDEARAALEKRPPVLLAPQSCIAALEASLLPFDEGLRREAELFAATVQSEQSRALRHLFFAEREAAKVPSLPTDAKPREIRAVGIVGGGTMGSAIAICCADAGLPVTLVEADAAALERARTRLRRHYDAAAKRGKLAEAEIDKRLQRITGTTALAYLAEADLVIEAVVEDLAVKREIFAALDRIAKPDALLATNTSYLEIAAIAAATARPESVLGLHFFAPATVMRVIEVARAPTSSDAAIATGLAFARKLRKLPVSVGATAGFVGNRLLLQRWRAIERLLADGVAIQAIDQAMTEFGFPVGPCAAADMAGLDISYGARRTLGLSLPLADAIVDVGRLGQKSGAGYYHYESDSRTPITDPEAQRIIDRARGSETRLDLPSEEIVQRILAPMVNEGARLIEEGVAARSSDIDVIWVYGYGFPAHRGGPMFYADCIGLPTLRDRLAADAARLNDAQLEPAPLLLSLAAEGKRFAELKR